MLNTITTRLFDAWTVFLKGKYALRSTRSDFRSLTPSEVDEARKFFPREKFFVYGAARSGTTLLSQLIDAHPDVLCWHQAHFFSREPFLHGLVSNPVVERWLNNHSNRWNRGTDMAPVVMRATADFILEREAERSGSKFVGDKSPNSLHNGKTIDFTHRIYPDAKIIFIIRDGRDATLSHRFQAFIDGTAHLNRRDWRIREAFKNDPDRFRAPDKSLFTPQGIRRYAENWVENIQTTISRGKALYGENFYSLRFEDLLSEPVEKLTEIWSFLGAEEFPERAEALNQLMNSNRDAKWQQKKAGAMADEIPKGQTGSWQEFFSVEDRRVFKQIAGKTLLEWGYEIDEDW